MKKQNNQSGFSAIEVLLLLVIVGILGFTGWFVWNAKQNSDNTLNGASKSSSSQAVISKKKVALPELTYLEIKEWGIKLPLSTSIVDAYYVASTSSETNGQPNTMWLGLKSLDSSGCAAAQPNSGGEYPIGAIIKSLPDATDPVTGELLTKVNPNGVTLNGYYYAYHSDVSSGTGCVFRNGIKNTAEIDAAFNTAGKTIVKE